MAILARIGPARDKRRVDRALAGDRAETDALVEQLVPAIQKRVGWVLSKGGRARRSDVLDYTQDVLVKLFENDGRILRSWDPDKGAALEGFVQMVAQRLVISALRSGRKSGWAEVPTFEDEFARKVSDDDLEEQAWNREMLDVILDRMEANLSPRGWDLFRALYVEEEPAEQVAERFEMSLNALYTWRSRFRSQARAWAEEAMKVEA